VGELPAGVRAVPQRRHRHAERQPVLRGAPTPPAGWASTAPPSTPPAPRPTRAASPCASPRTASPRYRRSSPSGSRWSRAHRYTLHGWVRARRPAATPACWRCSGSTRPTCSCPPRRSAHTLASECGPSTVHHVHRPGDRVTRGWSPTTPAPPRRRIPGASTSSPSPPRRAPCRRSGSTSPREYAGRSSSTVATPDVGSAAGTARPATLTATLENIDHALTFGNTASPLTGWKPGRRIRCYEVIGNRRYRPVLRLPAAAGDRRLGRAERRPVRHHHRRGPIGPARPPAARSCPPWPSTSSTTPATRCALYYPLGDTDGPTGRSSARTRSRR
jgi:hypothetical protein